MSLQEFFSDESYGGSWADDEIDISSISVPIEKKRGYDHGGASSYGSGGSRFGSSSGYGRGSYLDNGPPYIVKLSNIPVTSNDAFIEDLFRSRFTPMVKFKILFDPFSQPLESGIVKKIAFVELSSFDSQNKVAKWQDVFFKGTRRVTIEVADFSDFQQSMQFNSENHDALLQVERTFLSSRPRTGHHEDVGFGKDRHGRGTAGMPLDDIKSPDTQHRFGPQLRKRTGSNAESHHLGVNQESPDKTFSPSTDQTSVPKHRPNPFGNAKPIDVLARQHEIEKNLVTSKHTIMRAPWAKNQTGDTSVGHENVPKSAHSQDHGNGSLSAHSITTQQETGPKKSLADILGSSKARDQTKNSRTSSANSTPKPVVKKPTVIMKKPTVSTPEPPVGETVKGDVEAIEESTATLSIAPGVSSKTETEDSASSVTPDTEDPAVAAVSIEANNDGAKSKPPHPKNPRARSDRRASHDNGKQKHANTRSGDRRKSTEASQSAGVKRDDSEAPHKNVSDSRSRWSPRKPRSNSTTTNSSLGSEKDVNAPHLSERNHADETRKPRRDTQRNRSSRGRSTVDSTEQPENKDNVKQGERAARTKPRRPSTASKADGNPGSSESLSNTADSSQSGSRRGSGRDRGRGRSSRGGRERSERSERSERTGTGKEESNGTSHSEGRRRGPRGSSSGSKGSTKEDGAQT